MRRLPIPAILALLAALTLPPAAEAATGIGAAKPVRDFAPREVVVRYESEPQGRAVRIPRGVGVRAAVKALRARPDVAYAAPNFIARASGRLRPLPANGIPDDRGALGPAAATSPGGWTSVQWNMLPWQGTGGAQLPTSPGGIDAVGAWQNLEAVKRPGGRGVVVAVLDTGVAYRSWGKRFRRSPDFGARQFARGWDFVDNDALPLDENGHGTHVAGTIAERTHNGIGLTGIAYGATLMPVRVLDRHGAGQADAIARGIRFAVDSGADVINMSFNFGCGKKVPGVDQELRRAYHRGVVTVASVGNLGSEGCVSPPATGPRAIGVGGTTEGGCLGSYSLTGRAVDVVAPGGGPPVPGCASVSSRPIYQVTLKAGNPRQFTIPGNYVGTSMAAAHVSGVAAMVLAAGVLPRKVGPKGKVNRVTRRLRATSRSLNLPPAQQGAGLIDARRATERG